MSLINRKYLQQLIFEVKIKIFKNSIKVKNINSVVHNFSKFVSMNFFVSSFIKFEEKIIAYFIKKLHVVKKLKAKVLIDINILRLERINVLYNKKQIIIFSCDNFTASLIITLKDQRIKKTVKILKQIQIFSHISMTISVKIRNKNLLKNKVYLFKPKVFTDLNLNDDFLTHVINVNMIIV